MVVFNVFHNDKRVLVWWLMSHLKAIGCHNLGSCVFQMSLVVNIWSWLPGFSNLIYLCLSSCDYIWNALFLCSRFGTANRVSKGVKSHAIWLSELHVVNGRSRCRMVRRAADLRGYGLGWRPSSLVIFFADFVIEVMGLLQWVLESLVFDRLVGVIGLVALLTADRGLENSWGLRLVLIVLMESFFSLVIHGTIEKKTRCFYIIFG